MASAMAKLAGWTFVGLLTTWTGVAATAQTGGALELSALGDLAQSRQTPLETQGQALGYVDWGRRMLVATGQAPQTGPDAQSVALAKRAAYVVALRNAAAAAGGVPIGPNGTVAGLRNGTVRIQALLKDYEVSSYSSQTVGGKTVWTAHAQVPLYGVQSLAASVYEDQVGAYRKHIGRMGRRTLPGARQAPADDACVIIDARGSGFCPSMFPTFLDAKGKIVLDLVDLDKAILQQRGMCLYATSTVKFERLARGAMGLELALADGPAEGNIDGLPAGRVMLALAARPEPAVLPDTRPADTQPASLTPDTQPAQWPAHQLQPRRIERRYCFRATMPKDRPGMLTLADADGLAANEQAVALMRAGRVVVLVDGDVPS